MVECSDTTSNSSKGSVKEAVTKYDKDITVAVAGKVAIGDVYNDIGGDQYDAIATECKWNMPLALSELIGKGCVLDISTDSEILDVGAGTGTVGTYLKKKGFNNLTALDASEGLLKKAQEKGAYKAVHCMYVGMGVDKFPEELKQQFDVVTASGCFMEGHIPSAGFEDIHAALKTNGFAVINFKDCYLEDDAKEAYKPKLDQMVAEGKFKLFKESISYREEWRTEQISNHNKEVGEMIKDINLIYQRVN